MVLRLAFAISTSVQPEILVLDEMISAGDQRFAEKAALLREGRLIDVGPVESILERYAKEG